MPVYINKETGEIFMTRHEAEQNFRDDYDGFDPTNLISFWDIYEEFKA